MKAFVPRMVPGVVGLGLIATLAACGTISSLNPFNKEEPRLPGERIAIMKPQDTPSVERSGATRPVSLPQPPA